MALAAIDAGKHVYCEKPLAVSVTHAEAMQAAAAKRGVKTMVAFNNLKTPTAKLAREMIRKGEIGRPIASAVGSIRDFSRIRICLIPGAALGLRLVRAPLAISARMSSR